MSEDYSTIAEDIQSHPYFGSLQTILNCPEKTVRGRTVKDKILFREDPFRTHSTRISTIRAQRQNNIKKKPLEAEEDLEEVTSCNFCPPQIWDETTQPRIVHDRLRRGDFVPVTFQNLYGIDEISMITVFAEHKTKLIDLTFDDLVCYLETLYDTAQFLKDKYSARNVWDFVNWGFLAGASQEHPHAQRGTGPFKDTLSQKEAKYVAGYAYETGERFFEKYLGAIRDSPYLIWEEPEKDDLLIYAPFAPRFPHQVDLIPKKRIRHVLELKDPDQRIRMARSMLGVLHALYQNLRVTDVNIALHQEFFDIMGNFRMHWHIYPRNLNTLAGFELGHEGYVVNKFPEETADVLRSYYHR